MAMKSEEGQMNLKYPDVLGFSEKKVNKPIKISL